MMMRHLLSTTIVLSTLSSTAIAAPGLLDAGPHVASGMHVDAKPSASGDDGVGASATYISASGVFLTGVLGVPAMVHAELGRRISDESNLYLHAVAGTALGLPLNEGRLGIERRGRGEDVRAFGGIDAGAWLWSVGDESGSTIEIVPRIGFEVGNRVWLRGALEMPLFVSSESTSDTVLLEVTLGLGVSL